MTAKIHLITETDFFSIHFLHERIRPAYSEVGAFQSAALGVNVISLFAYNRNIVVNQPVFFNRPVRISRNLPYNPPIFYLLNLA